MYQGKSIACKAWWTGTVCVCRNCQPDGKRPCSSGVWYRRLCFPDAERPGRCRLKTAINSPSKTNQVLQQILNLAEFMELDENSDIKLFSSKTLASIAENCNAYAKALYYWEQEFENGPKDTVELLI